MKIAGQQTNQQQGYSHPQGFNAPIPFEKVERKTPQKGDATEFKLYTRPDDESSQTYTVEVRHFSSGSPENWLETLDDIHRILRGSRITTADASVAIVRAVLKGEALRIFESGVTINGTSDMNAFDKCLQNVTTHLFPPRALVRQKRYLRWYARKPRGTSIRDYIVRLRDLNEQLKHFPPFNPEAQQKLPDDELIEIVEHSIPRTWQREMTVQGFDPIEHSLQELSEFCERQETAEEMNPQSAVNAQKRGNKRKHGARPEADADSHGENTAFSGAKSSEEAPKKKSKPNKWCVLHNTNKHDTNECKVLLAQAERMRAMWKAKNPDVKHQQDKKKKDMHALIDEMLAEHIQSKLAKKAKQSKSDSEHSDESEHDDNFDCNLDEYINSKVYETYEQFTLARLRHPNVGAHAQHAIDVAPITVAHVKSRERTNNIHKLKVLLDSGASGSIITSTHVRKLPKTHTSERLWATQAGPMTTHSTCDIKFTLPEFFETRVIEATVNIDERVGPHRYDMLIGRDLLQKLKIIVNFDDLTVTWDNASIYMRDYNALTNVLKDNSHFFWCEEANETDALQSATERIKKILDAKYEKANLDEIVHKCSYLTEHEQFKLLQLLKKHEHLFDGTLGRWDAQPYDIELKPDAKPYHARAFPVPKIHEPTFRMELDRLCKLGVLRKINESEWAAPAFIIPKKDTTVRFLSDFRELNKRIKRKPYPIPNIQDLLRKLEGFMYATSLDLNMGYYHIVLTPASSRLCTIVTPWGKYEYLRLPMGLCNSPDIFQERMNELMSGLDFVRAYIDDILTMTNGDWDDHLAKLDEVFTRLGLVGLKVNIRKSFFGRSATEYLGFWITRNGISPLPKKVEAILNIAPPTNKKQLRRFIGLVNYYRDMWIHRSHVLTPLTALTSKNAKWQWTEVEQKAFATMKKIVSRETLLAYPDFNRPFHIYTDASHAQLGAVISQNKHPIAFYSRKLNPAQTRYTTTERELLSIVETLKEFRNVLLGQQIIIHTDHQNLTHKNFNTERVMRWRLIIEEFSPTFEYIKGIHNVVADALSRLDITAPATPLDGFSMTPADYSDLFGKDVDDLPEDVFPLEYRLIDKYQQLDKTLLQKLTTHRPGFHAKSFRGGGKDWTLICHNDKIVIPSQLTKRVTTWYHETLCHPGITRTEESIGQHLWWPNMRTEITTHVSRCATCQLNKKQRKKYGLLPEKEAESEPWEKLCVDLIGPYTIKRKRKPDLHVKCVTMIDPATGWFEIAEYDDKQSITVANIVERMWLTRYPLPTQIIFDRGSEFMGQDFTDMIAKDYGIKKKPITVRNPQANAVLERVHQTLGNIVRTFELEDKYLDEDDPWAGILSAAAFAIRSTYHTTLQASPGQLVFGRDMIFNIKHVANWQAIKQKKQQIIQKNNKRENAKRIPHEYRIGDLVLLTRNQPNKYERPYEGPYKIEEVLTNGTVCLKKGVVIETVNIRRLQPFKAPTTNRGGECNMRLAKRRRLA